MAKKKGVPSDAPATDDKTMADVLDEYAARDREAPKLTRYLEYKLTEDDKYEMRLAREKRDAEADKLNAELLKVQARVKELKEEVAGIASRNANESRIITAGVDHRDVEIWESERRINGELYRVAYRVDTWEEVDRRPLEKSERQGDLFG